MPLPEGFNICVQYYRQPTPPPAEWEDDLKHVRDLGFNGIQLRPQWGWHEVREGEYRWDDLDRLIGLAGELGLGVIFKFMLETAPLWLFRDYEAGRVNPDGTRCPHRGRGAFYIGGWMPCFDRDLVWEKAERFVGEVVERYRGSPAILGWHLWNEPRSRPYGDCACEDSSRKYRRWLAEQFGPVERFNERFGVAVRDYEDIDPPPDISSYYDSWLWRTWRAHAVAERIEKLAGLVRGMDSERPLFTHVGFNSVLQTTFIDTCHDYLTARHVDVYGTSLPHWTGDFHTFFKVDRSALFTNPGFRTESYLYSMQARWIASVKEYFWINEVYGNSWNYMAEDYTGDDIRFMMLSTIAEGARGLVIWQFKAERFSEESITSGLVNLDGTDTDRSLAAGAICEAASREPEAFDTYRPGKARVALVFSFAADMYSEMEDAESIENVGTVSYRYKESLKGYYSMLWRLGLDADFIPVEEIGRISGYDAVILPYLHILEEEHARELDEYVRGGGCLISDPGLAFRDGRAWVHATRPGWGLDELFGCREVRLKAVLSPMTVTLMDREVNATRMCGRLEPAEGAEDLSGGEGLLVRNESGRGRTYYFGLFPGVSYRDTAQDRYLSMMARVLADAGIQIRYVPTSYLVKVRRGTVGKDGEHPAAFVFNYEAWEVELPHSQLIEGEYRCVLTGRKIDTREPCMVGPREVLFLVPAEF